MRVKIILLMLCAVVMAASCSATVKLPWDLVLIDISGDLKCHDKDGKAEIQLLNAAITELNKFASESDSVVVFADGRIQISFLDFIKNYQGSEGWLLDCIGDGTTIYNTLLSVLNKPRIPQRILIVSNGLDYGSSFHPNAASAILKSRGVRVDGLCIYSPADSITYDSFYYPKPDYDRNFRKAIKATGGRFVEVSEETEMAAAIESLLKSSAKNPSNRHSNNGYDQAILDNALKRIPEMQFNIMEVDTATCIKYNGVVIKGLSGIIDLVGFCQDGVYVAWDREQYPCFDDYDRMSENRYYTNFYMANSYGELYEKSKIIAGIKPSVNYCKLHQSVPLEVLPMIYYCGEGDTMEICGFEIVYE